MAKPGFILAIGGAKKGGAPAMGADDDDAPDSGDAKSDKDDAIHSAMSDLLDAIKGDDVDAAVDAWRDLCELDKDKDEDEDEGA